MELSTKNFTAKEFRCKCEKCKGEVPHKMEPITLELLQALRELLGRPVSLTSAYRCADHPEEAKKTSPGQHNKGTAVDIKVSNGADRYRILDKAFELGFTGIGVANSFIHLDTRTDTPVVWKY